jgi:tetratricopeptide (TPR) repeat protein
MYLRGSKWKMTKRRRRPSNPLKLLLLIGLIGVVLYFNQVVVPTMPMPFSVTPTPTRSPESFLNEAQAYFEQGKLSQSIASYQQAIMADPGNPSLFLDLARTQIYAGDYANAKINAENAALLNPDNSLAHTLRAWALNFMEQSLEAEGAVKKAIELDPNNPLAYAVYTEILLDRGNYDDIDDAIDKSRKAEELAPNALETHRARGYVLLYTGNYPESIKEYQAALAVNDKLWDLHYSLGAAYRLNGDYDLAINELLAAFALNPTNPEIPTELSRTHATQGEYPKAIQYAEQAVAVDPSLARLHGNLGVMLYRNGDYDRAIEELGLVVHGGTTQDGIPVEGLPLAPGRIADDYYSIYALSLTKTDRCGQALPVLQLILSNIEEDEVAFYNASEGMAYCMETLGTPMPPAETTPTPTPTP